MKKPSTTASAASYHPECPHSPLRFHSPHRSDLGDPPESPPYASPENPSYAVSTANKHTQCSPALSSLPVSWTNENSKGRATAAVVGRAVREVVSPPVAVDARFPAGHGRRSTVVSKTRVSTLQKTALLFRVCEVVVCMISFSVMAADKVKGWSGDSYDRYVEYRYCLVVTAIAFVYSLLQACDLACRIIARKEGIQTCHKHFDLLMDQVLSYLLISASSSAVTRLYDWQLNWGKDKFTEMATVSIINSFIAFIAFASSSTISSLFVFHPDIA